MTCANDWSLQRFGSHALLFGRFRVRATIRDAWSSDLALGRRYSLTSKTSIRRSSAVCAIRRYPSGISERSPLAKRRWTEAISLAKELNDMNALAMALGWAAGLAEIERNPAEVDRLASDLIELSTRHNFAYWLAVGAIHRGWARSASGDTAEGIPWIEQGIRDFRATGTVLVLPYFLGLKAEALHLADRTLKLLRQLRRRKHWSKNLKSASGVPNCTGSAVCFSRLWELMRPKLRLRSRSHQNRKGAEVDFIRETRRSNLRRIPPPKSERVRRTWIPTTSLVTSCSSRPFVQRHIRDCRQFEHLEQTLGALAQQPFLATDDRQAQRVGNEPTAATAMATDHDIVAHRHGWK